MMPKRAPVILSVGQRTVRAQAKERARAARARYDERRTDDRAFYWSERWKALRKMILAEQPLCQHCSAEATEVDHIEPRSKRKDLELVRENLRALCKSCHSSVTTTERHRSGRGGQKC